jgi:hypothetical protein
VKANLAVMELTSKNGGESLISKKVRVGDLLYHGVDVTKYGKHLILVENGNNSVDITRSELIEEFQEGLYGILSLKNGRHEHAFVVDSGLTNKDQVGKIILWNSLSMLNWWKGDRCNAINGSDSSVFPPYLGQKSVLQVFDLDFCRSISFKFSKEMLFHNAVQGLTYNIADDTLEDPKVFELNNCFCKGGPDTCLKKGVIDVSPCHGGMYIHT